MTRHARSATQGALFGPDRLLRQSVPADACAHHGIRQCEACRERVQGAASTPDEWDRFIGSAPTFADATDRIEEAVNAGVDFAALLSAQRDRTGVTA